MHMIFWWDYNLQNYLIYGFNIKSCGGLFGLCILVTIFAFGFEWMRYLQTKQRQRELILRAKQLSLICSMDSETALLSQNIRDRGNPLNITLLDRALLFGTEVTLWFFLQSLGYILMLSAMLYNGWLFISCIIGGGIGYFVFGQKFMKINMQNCQILRDTICMAVCAEPENAQKEGESTPVLEQSPTTSHSKEHCSHSKNNSDEIVTVHQN